VDNRQPLSALASNEGNDCALTIRGAIDTSAVQGPSKTATPRSKLTCLCERTGMPLVVATVDVQEGRCPRSSAPGVRIKCITHV
jgi:hypothetical protein